MNGVHNEQKTSTSMVYVDYDIYVKHIYKQKQ